MKLLTLSKYYSYFIYQLFKNKNQADWFAADTRANLENLLKERGYGTEEIEALRAQNVIE